MLAGERWVLFLVGPAGRVWPILGSINLAGIRDAWWCGMTKSPPDVETRTGPLAQEAQDPTSDSVCAAPGAADAPAGLGFGRVPPRRFGPPSPGQRATWRWFVRTASPTRQPVDRSGPNGD